MARIRLAADTSILFDRAPEWTKAHILPMLDWSNPIAVHAWEARKYSNYIGSPMLFGLTKRPFLELFERVEISADTLRVFADWLVAIVIANRQKPELYPLSGKEARTALRRSGGRALSAVAHRLAIEMERAKEDEKLSRWRTIVGPAFQDIWPLDIELQGGEQTFKLVQILRGSGSAFSEAADVIVPFLFPEKDQAMTSIYSISEAGDDIYASSPEKVLGVLDSVIGDTPSSRVPSLKKALTRVLQFEPLLESSKPFQRLMRFAEQQ